MAYRSSIDDGWWREARATRRALLGAGVATAAALPLAACGAHQRNEDPALLVAAGVARATPGPSAPVAAATSGMTTLARRIISTTAAATNFVISPLSLACAFAMARVGAGGETAAQLDRVFGFPATGRDEAFNAITRRLATATTPPTADTWKPGEPPPPPIVAMGDALFTAKDLTIGAAFLRALAAQYGAGARPVDFTSPQGAAQINSWVRKQTAGRITRLFDELDPGTLLVLANTIYFKAHWKNTFEPALTRDAPFTRGDGSAVTAPMMSEVVTARYAESDNIRAVELPYAGGPYAMWILLPPAGRPPVDALNPDALANIARSLRDAQLSVTMPRFDFGTDMDLNKVLMGLGLTAPFGSGADFSGIAPGLFISQAVHRANITVTEEGTEAAAVTGIAMATSGVIAPPLSFVADRPFAFMIVGGADRVPLFVGQVTDPTKR